MNEKLKVARTVADLARVRLVEFDQEDSDETTISKRYSPTDQRWITLYDDGTLVRLGTAALVRDGPCRILAEFPLTLADLIPEDCQAFRFKHNGLTNTAVFDMVYKTWEVTGHDGDFATLDSLAEHFGIELDTVVPLALTIHPQYMEERR